MVFYPHQLQVATNGREMRFHVRAKMSSQEGVLENPGMFRNGTGSTFAHGEYAIVWIWRWFVTRDSTKQRECLRDSWARNCHSVYYPRQCVDLSWICGWKYNLPACGHSPAEWCLWHWNSSLTSWACPAISGNSSPQDVLSLYVIGLCPTSRSSLRSPAETHKSVISAWWSSVT